MNHQSILARQMGGVVLTAVLSLLMLAACNADDFDTQGGDRQPVPLRPVATLGSWPATRGYLVAVPRITGGTLRIQLLNEKAENTVHAFYTFNEKGELEHDLLFGQGFGGGSQSVMPGVATGFFVTSLNPVSPIIDDQDRYRRILSCAIDETLTDGSVTEIPFHILARTGAKYDGVWMNEVMPSDPMATVVPAADGTITFRLDLQTAALRLNLVQVPGSQAVQSVRLYDNGGGFLWKEDYRYTAAAIAADPALTGTPPGIIPISPYPDGGLPQSAAIMGLMYPRTYPAGAPFAVVTLADGSETLLFTPSQLSIGMGQMITYRVWVEGNMVKVTGEAGIQDFLSANAGGENVKVGYNNASIFDGSKNWGTNFLAGFDPHAGTWLVTGGGTREADAIVCTNLREALDATGNIHPINLILTEATSIPTYNGKGAFAKYTELSSVSAPKVITIGEQAFSECTNLASASFPLAKQVGERAFYLDSKLSFIDLPKAETIQPQAFGACGITTLYLPEAKTIGASAAQGCYSLSSVNLPLATEIGDGAFGNCPKLTGINLPKVAKLGSQLFFNNTPSRFRLLLGGENVEVDREAFDGFTISAGHTLVLNKDQQGEVSGTKGAMTWTGSGTLTWQDISFLP